MIGTLLRHNNPCSPSEQHIHRCIVFHVDVLHLDDRQLFSNENRTRRKRVHYTNVAVSNADVVVSSKGEYLSVFGWKLRQPDVDV